MTPAAPRRCTCRPGCLTFVTALDALTPGGALVEHAAYVAAVPPPSAPYPDNPLSARLRGVGGTPRRL